MKIPMEVAKKKRKSKKPKSVSREAVAKATDEEVLDLDSSRTPSSAKRGVRGRRRRDDDDDDDSELERTAAIRPRFLDYVPDDIPVSAPELERIARKSLSRISPGRRVISDTTTNCLPGDVSFIDLWDLSPGLSMAPAGGIGGFKDTGVPDLWNMGAAKSCSLRSVQISGRIALIPPSFLGFAHVPQIYVSLMVVYDRSGWNFGESGIPDVTDIYMDQQVVSISGVTYSKTGPNCLLTNPFGSDRFRVMRKVNYVLHYRPDMQHFGYYMNTTGVMAMADPLNDGVVNTTGSVDAVTPDGGIVWSDRDGLFTPVNEFVDLHGLPQNYQPEILYLNNSQLNVRTGSVFLMAYCSLPTSMYDAGWRVKPELFVRATATVKN